MYVSFMEFDH